ncbi:MAG: ABC transporter ATP-binding protein [Anaerolineaceae bacterium]|mgnify:CR=1 FL=1|nr:ABC transporter ATP-binding protein [Anaerolineaceae bacterium]HNX45903.1 ABC transporter ATP-binding protein [Anaerolineaceae bacterium]HPT24619.1 ABC transporter ATP-binding protein [Anaerolineaceae bacterium]
MRIESETVQATSQDAPVVQNMIQLENVSVEYRIPTERIGTLKEFMIRYLQRRVGFRKFRALDNVSLSIHKGEVFGIVGNNGAGKSTMLKVISRVLRPTLGRIVTYGKIAPLLELGAGFHPELSGRENVYLNGALLGYSREDMDRVFDEIVSFAELEPFIDSPIRTYSSGMYARLGFAVATAHFPEILIVDEILSVGDEAFQKKCNDRMIGFRQQGATVLIVSHALDRLQDMCDRIAWLDHGKLQLVGQPGQVIEAYRQEMH